MTPSLLLFPEKKSLQNTLRWKNIFLVINRTSKRKKLVGSSQIKLKQSLYIYKYEDAFFHIQPGHSKQRMPAEPTGFHSN